MLECGLHCWRMCVTVGAGFEVSLAQDTPEGVSQLAWPAYKDIASTRSACTLYPHHDDNELNL